MIKINEKYYIEADSRNYMLKEKTIITTKEGAKTEGFKELGHYTTLESLCNGLVKTELRNFITESDNGSLKDLLSKLKELEKFFNDKLKNI